MGVRGAAAAALMFSVVGLAACSSGGSGYGSGGGAAGGSAAPPSSGGAGSSLALQTESTPLGTILVDGKKMTVYVYDKDTPNSGKSSCSGPCAAAWPEVTTTSKSPKVKGVTGKVATIKGMDGKNQITINGWPLYTYAKDSKPGDTTGQGVGGVWWVVGANGNKITKTAAASSSSGYGNY